MSRKNRHDWHEPVNQTPEVGMVEAIVVEVVDPINDTIEVGEIILVDGPLDPVPFGEEMGGMEGYEAPRSSAGPMPGFETGERLQDGVKDVTQKVQGSAQGIADKAQDAAQSLTGKAQDAAQSLTGKAQDAAQGAAGKAKDAAQAVTDKAQSVASTVADKAQDVSGKISDGAASVKSSAAEAVPATTAAAGKLGTAMWVFIQRSPLQFLTVIASLIWLLRNNQAAAALPSVSLSDAAGGAAEKVGTVAGQVQVAASNLGSQVQEQAQRGTGWFSRTLQESPLAIGAMALAVGAGLGLAVPESSYENQLLGKTRDDLVGKVQGQAQDLTQKVATVAQTAVHEAVEKGKEEAKNQGLTAEAVSGEAVSGEAVSGAAEEPKPDDPAPVPADEQAQQQS